ncbi:helix-turn-helix domain-containing protein [Mesorhizobium sp.]|uniref:helix-turn-helix domain-containing protein n=1 Tax=Mesorhizobium sp. TaxID=1871066 RepID=UPI000FE8FBA9|nr:helix-turn-helix domain-containing protein [Mesorhizobium sp.]RWP98755.1 MAG: DNA-binding protein [Mesorhizobium sp.]
MEDEILTIQEIAVRLKLAERTVYAMATAREFPAFKVRGQWRVKRSDFEAWLQRVIAAGGDGHNNAGGDALSDQQPSAVPANIDTGIISSPTPPRGASAALAVKALSDRLTQLDLHRHFITMLGKGVTSHSALSQKPLELDLASPFPGRVRIYLFNATRPPGGRPLGEHKVQLIMPGQRRDERGSFDHGDGRMVFLVGYAAEEDVFVLWDAGLYPDFAWSRNVQVKAETIVEASAGKLATQQRHLRPADGQAVTETLLAAPASRLVEAMQRRVQLTRERMMHA